MRKSQLFHCGAAVLPLLLAVNFLTVVVGVVVIQISCGLLVNAPRET